MRARHSGLVRLRPGADGAGDFTRIWQDLSRLLHDLPALPDSVRLLQHHLNHSPVDLSVIGWVVRRDPALATQIFRLSNHFISEDSPCITALEECLVLLGLDCLRAQLLPNGEQWPHQQIRRLEELRRHSALAAALSRNIAETMGYPDPERVYFAGLLHDLGKFPPLMLSADRLTAGSEDNPSEGAMLAHSGFVTDHCAFGAWLAAIWKLPGFLADCIEYHHDVDSAHVEPWVVKMVASGNHLTHVLMGDRGSGASELDLHTILRRLLPSLSWAQATTLQGRVSQTYANWREGESGDRTPGNFRLDPWFQGQEGQS
jgi:HD-like signal output (HDOD) protein